MPTPIIGIIIDCTQFHRTAQTATIAVGLTAYAKIVHVFIISKTGKLSNSLNHATTIIMLRKLRLTSTTIKTRQSAEITFLK